MTQEQIVYENVCLDLTLGPYAQYLKHPQSVGAVCQWLRAFGCRDYDRVQIGFRNDIGTVELFGKIVATFRFVDDVPIFSFRDNGHTSYFDHRQKLYHEGKTKFKNPYEQYTNT